MPFYYSRTAGREYIRLAELRHGVAKSRAVEKNAQANERPLLKTNLKVPIRTPWISWTSISGRRSCLKIVLDAGAGLGLSLCSKGNGLEDRAEAYIFSITSLAVLSCL